MLTRGSPGGKPLDVIICSNGGDVGACFLVVGILRRVRQAGRHVVTHVGGEAFSGASIVLQGGDLRTIDKGSMLMLHAPNWAVSTNASIQEHVDNVYCAQRQFENMLELYGLRTGKSAEYWRERIGQRDIYLTPADALAEGLVDEVIPFSVGSPSKGQQSRPKRRPP